MGRLAAAAALLATSLVTNILVGFLGLGAILGVAAFVLWFQNRHNLRDLDDMLRDKATQGLAALGVDPADVDGA